MTGQIDVLAEERRGQSLTDASGYWFDRRSELVELEEADVGANPLFVIALWPAEALERVEVLTALVGEPVRFAARLLKRREGLVVKT